MQVDTNKLLFDKKVSTEIKINIQKVKRFNNQGVSAPCLLANPVLLTRIKCCDIPHPHTLLTRELVHRRRGAISSEITFSRREAESNIQSVFSIPIDDCPFGCLSKQFGGVDGIVRNGAFLSFREIVAIFRNNVFREPTYVSIVTHKRLNDLRWVILQVFDDVKGNFRHIRSRFHDEVSDIFPSDMDAQLILRPSHVLPIQGLWQ